MLNELSKYWPNGLISLILKLSMFLSSWCHFFTIISRSQMITWKILQWFADNINHTYFIILRTMKNLAVGVRYFFAIVSLFVDIRSLSAPPGHMKPLGWHRASSGGLQTIGNVFPRAGVFYKFFIKVSKPLHFADVLNKENHAAFANWTDDYLR